MKVEFKFNIGDDVKTSLGSIGIIETCALFDDGSIQYSVKTKDSNMWWKEIHLIKKI